MNNKEARLLMLEYNINGLTRDVNYWRREVYRKISLLYDYLGVEEQHIPTEDKLVKKSKVT